MEPTAGTCQCDIDPRTETVDRSTIVLEEPLVCDCTDVDHTKRVYCTAAADVRNRSIAPETRMVPRRSHIVVVYRNFMNPKDKLVRIHCISTSVKVLRQLIAKLIATEPNNVLLMKNNFQLKDNYPVSDIRYSNMNFVEVTVKTLDNSEFCLGSIPPDKHVEMRNMLDPCLKRSVDYIVVKYRIRYQDQTFTCSYVPTVKIGEIKTTLAKIFNMDVANLDIQKNTVSQPDQRQLHCLQYDEFGNLELEVVTKDEKRLDLEQYYRCLCFEAVPDILSVTVQLNSQTSFNVNVEIIDKKVCKPFLGGYRNIETGTEYHNAVTQTIPKMGRVLPENKLSRITQTAPSKEKNINTVITTATQMASRAYCLPCDTDTVVAPGDYEPYDVMVERLRHEHYVGIIQRAYRAYRYRVMINTWLKECRARYQRLRDEENREKEAMEQRILNDVTAKTFPRTRDDFNQLYAMVDKWKHSERARIARMHNKAPKLAELARLLEKETELLRAIEESKVNMKEDSRKLKTQKFLETISSPVVFYNKTGKLIAMDTVEAQRARKIKDIYNSFCKNVTNIEDRVALLADLRNSLRDFLHPLTEELISLVDRECELLIRSCTNKDLEFLRERIRLMLLRFVETSELNSGITRRKEKAEFNESEGGNLYRCKMCGKLKHWKDLMLDSRTTELALCKSCGWHNFSTRPWTDTSPFRFLLRAVQGDERRKKSWDSTAFIMQPSDMYFLVDMIWHSKSALSEINDMYVLRMCRWNKNEEWSPWNCILLTLDEMKSHIMLDSPLEIYDEEFVIDVKNKHATAKKQFQQLTDVNLAFTGTGAWHKIVAKPSDKTAGVEQL